MRLKTSKSGLNALPVLMFAIMPIAAYEPCELVELPMAGVVASTPLTVDQQTSASQGQQIVAENNCRNCHSIAGMGASGPGPNLDQVTERRTQDWLRRWLRDPQALKPGTVMPTFGFTDTQIDALIAYLESLSTPAAAPDTSYETRGDRSLSDLQLTKSWFTLVLSILTLIAAWSMFERLGAPRRPLVSRETALFIHRVNGYLFAALALLISQSCVRTLLQSAGEWTPRVAIHIAVAVVILVVLGIKIALARRYSAGLGNLLPPLGITLLIATWVLAVGSAGFYFVIVTGR